MIKTIDYCLFIVITIKMLLLSVIRFDYLILPSNTLPAPFCWIFMRYIVSLEIYIYENSKDMLIMQIKFASSWRRLESAVIFIFLFIRKPNIGIRKTCYLSFADLLSNPIPYSLFHSEHIRVAGVGSHVVNNNILFRNITNVGWLSL